MDAVGTWGRRASQGSRPKHAVWLGRWAALSIGLHGLMLAGIVSLHVPASPPRESSLRVRLVTEVREAPPPLPAPPAPQRTRPRASPPMASQARASRATPPPEMTRPAEAEPPAMGQNPPSQDPEPAAMPVRLPAPSGMAREALPPSGSPGGGGDSARELRPAATTSVVETPSAPASPKSETKAQGIVLLPGGSGSATDRGGAGAGDQGSGNGGGGIGTNERRGQGAGGGAAGRGGGLEGGTASRGGGAGDGLAGLLRAIRRRIEQAKTYPDAARLAGMEGTVELRFRIGRDGNAEALEVVRSSGHVELDDMAMQTVRRAGPYPVVSGRIRIPLSYRLDQSP